MKANSHRIILAGILLAHLSLALFTLTGDHDWGGDFSEYISQAASIDRGDFRPLSQGAPVRTYLGYPWGTGLLLAPFYMVFGFNIFALKLLNVSCFLILLFIVWWNWRNTLPVGYRLALVVILGVQPVFLKYMNMVLSDIPAMLFASAAAMLMPRLLSNEDSLTTKPIDALILGLLMAVAYTLRPACLVLPVALAASQLLGVGGYMLKSKQRMGRLEISVGPATRHRLMAVGRAIGCQALPYIIFMLYIHAWYLIFPENVSSFMLGAAKDRPQGIISHMVFIWDKLSFFVNRFVNQALYYWDVAPSFFLNSSFLFCFSLPWVVWGMLATRRREFPILIYMGGTLLMYFLYPGRQNERYLFAIVPFYFYYLVVGVYLSCSRLGAKSPGFLRMSTLAWTLVASFFVISQIYQAVGNANQRRSWFPCFGPYAHHSQNMFAYIRTNTESQDIVLFFKPRVMRLYAGRWSQLPDHWDTNQPGHGYYYVHCNVYELREQRKIHSSLSDRTRFVQVYRNNWFTVYRIHVKLPGASSLIGSGSSTPAHFRLKSSQHKNQAAV